MANSSTIIAATDGREQSDGAIRAGALLAEMGRAWRIVSVVPPFPIVSPELDLRIGAEVIDASREERHTVVKEQVSRLLGKQVNVDIDIRSGHPADTIARVAGEANAALVVTGLGRHRLIDRLLADETALQIVRTAPAPVLAVPMEFNRLPQTAIVGVDFSEASMHAARAALQIVRDTATVYLANVAPREDVLSLATGGRAAYEAQAMVELRQFADRLELSDQVHVQPVVRQGDPGSALLSYAEETHSDLIAIGTRGLGLVSRLLLGSVATKVIRASTIAVLTVPA